MSCGKLKGVLVVVLALGVGAIALGGCGEDGEEPTSAAPTTTRGDDADAHQSSPNAARLPAEEFRGGEASIEDFGSEAEGSEREAILGVFTDYLNAVAEKDYASACADLSASIKRSLGQIASATLRAKGCPAILPKLLAPSASQIAREQAGGRITRVRARGGQAFVVFAAPGAELYQVTMVEEDGEWKAAVVAASVLVPEL